MVRSLYSGISGLRGHQVALDVTGNNIANVNTIGFKAGRATFKESMAQMLQGPSRPAGNYGGTNPLQVGLGTSIASIDLMLRQGNMQTTGQITDLAIEGSGFFVFAQGANKFYGRNGGLHLDATGRLVSPTNGWALQGKMADALGNYPAGTIIGDIRIPWGEKAPAKATSQIDFACNLNMDSHPLGTVTHTNRFIRDAGVLNDPAEYERGLMTNLFDENGNSLGIKIGDRLTLGWSDSNDTATWLIDEDSLLIDPNDPSNTNTFTSFLETYLNSITGGGVTVTLNNDGTLQIDNSSSTSINGFHIKSDRMANSNSFISNALGFGNTISVPPNNIATSRLALMVPAAAQDLLADIRDASGEPLGLEDGDPININGSVGGRNEKGGLTYDPLTTTMADLIGELMHVFGMPPTDGTIQERPSVYIKQKNDVNDGIPLGSIVLRGQPEVAFALTQLSIRAEDSNRQTPSPTRFNMNMSFTEVQAARNTGVHDASLIVYDESGAPHNVTMTFSHTGIPNEWIWEIDVAGDQQVVAGNRGRIVFGLDGTPAAFTFDDDVGQFIFEPMNGASQVRIALNVGGPGSLLGITQFDSPTTTVARDQDGYPMGKLREITIDEKGEISGIYTNSVTKAIAQIFIAEFNNPAGLLKMGDSMYAESNNSGYPVMYQPVVGTASKIKPGALEMSNVELETEFTNMITIQRGYQANSRVITTSDQLLQELVNIVR